MASQFWPSSSSPSPCNEYTIQASLFILFANAAQIATLIPWPKEPEATLIPGNPSWVAGCP